ncbi:MAG: DUF3108 domain-containing protein [Pyrinomonadaceae bacterium]|nr:DUF3108 domain-containing protein [Pyrinomonadaceae bacterium]
MRLSKLSALLIIFPVLCFSAFAQPEPDKAVSKMPFGPGEVLVYEGKLTKIISVGGIADLTFSVLQGEEPGRLIIKTKAVSKGGFLSLLSFSFLQEYETVADMSAGRVYKTTKHDVQKERVRDSVADFDYKEKRVTFVETNPKEPTRPPRNIASAVGDKMWDLTSAIYSLRLAPLAVGANLQVPVSDSGLVYDVPVRVTARERQNSIFGKVWCWRVEPMIFGDGRLIEQKGKMVIWITDDARRLPVRSKISTSFGKLDVRLKSVVS